MNGEIQIRKDSKEKLRNEILEEERFFKKLGSGFGSQEVDGDDADRETIRLTLGSGNI